MKRVLSTIAMCCVLAFTVPMLFQVNVKAANKVLGGMQPSYSCREQSGTITLETENMWRAETNDSWIHLMSSTGAYTSYLTFNLDENTSDNSRMGFITVYDTKLYYPIFTFEINQDAYEIDKYNAVKILTYPSKSNEAIGADLKLELLAATDWNLTCDASYVKVSPSAGVASTNKQVVTITLPQNTSTSSRTINFTLNSNDYPESIREFSINQKGKEKPDDPALDESNEFYYTNGSCFYVFKFGGEVDIEFTSRVNWYIIDDGADFRALSFNKTAGGPGKHKIKVMVPANRDPFDRTYNICIMGQSKYYNVIITVGTVG